LGGYGPFCGPGGGHGGGLHRSQPGSRGPGADRKEYRYCGYAEALARGSAAAPERLRTILGLPETTCWQELLTEYRKHLFLRGALATNQHGPAFDLAKAQEEG
jgi:hypothetical protein